MQQNNSMKTNDNAPNAPISSAPSSAALNVAHNIAHLSTNATYTNTTSTQDHNHNRNGTGYLSEHGHHLSSIAPMAVHSGSSVATFFNGLFQTILAIATLGASITFNYVLSNGGTSTIDDPAQLSSGPGPKFGAKTVQLFLSISWLLFLLALAVASLGSTLLTFFRAHWSRDWDGLHGRTSQVTVQWYAVIASTLMGLLVIGAFTLLCLVVVAYSPVVGWLALTFTAIFGIIIGVAICNQVPWPCGCWKAKRENIVEKEGRATTV